MTVPPEASSVASPAPSSTAAQSTATTSPAAPSGVTFETVILGPGDKPIAKADIAPRIFRDDPAVAKALTTSFAADRAALGGPEGDHLILVLGIEGAAASSNGVDVYADVFEQWYSLDGWKPVEGSGSIAPARIRLARDGGTYHLDGADWPEDGDGYSGSFSKIFPGWVQHRMGDQATVKPMQEADWRAAVDWAKPHVPADLFVDPSPSATMDPHAHSPASSRYRMLAPGYVDCTIAPMSPPTSDDYQPEYAYPSKDGRFRLFFLLSSSGVAVEDTKTGAWHSVVAPGEPDMHVEGATSFDPAWSGHMLFIDFSTYQDPYQPTLTHYEIDFDTTTVVRAVPMGPLSFNDPMK
jgi:hypothetical protein